MPTNVFKLTCMKQNLLQKSVIWNNRTNKSAKQNPIYKCFCPTTGEIATHTCLWLALHHADPVNHFNQGHLNYASQSPTQWGYQGVSPCNVRWSEKGGLVPIPIIYREGITFLQHTANSRCMISIYHFRIRVPYWFKSGFKFLRRLQTRVKKIKQQAQSKYTTPIILQDLETNIRDAFVRYQQVILPLVPWGISKGFYSEGLLQ
jgi:hypothetical protein